MFEKIQNGVMGYIGAWGKLIDEKNLKSKISLHCPFNVQYQQTLPFRRLDPLTVTTGIFNT